MNTQARLNVAPTTRVVNRREVAARAVKKAGPTSYEGVVLMRPDCDDDTRAAALEGFKGMFGEGLESWDVTDHGLKQNAYEIKGYPDAYQVVVNFSCAAGTYRDAAAELCKPTVGSEEVIIRSMIMKV